MRILPGIRPGHRATVFDEATRLLEDGFTREMVLAEYPRERDWLESMLDTAHDVEYALDSEPASYYFEASLKSRFLEAARERSYRPQYRGKQFPARMRTIVATATVLTGTATAGTVTYGFVTAGQAVPGDWNYAFKQTTERLEYALAQGDDRVDIQIHQAQSRVYEIKVLNERDRISPDLIRRLEQEASQLRTQIERAPSVNPIQQAQLRALHDITSVVLADAAKKDESIRPVADSALNAVSEAVAAGGGGTTVAITEPTPSPTAPATAATTATATVETATPSPTTETPTATATPSPTETATPSPTSEPETATPTPTEEPSATAEPSATSETPPPPTASSPE